MEPAPPYGRHDLVVPPFFFAASPLARARPRRTIAASPQRGFVMDKTLIEALARQAGLDRALAEFPDCVMAAAKQAIGRSSEINTPTNPAVEPWPPMKVGAGA